MKKTYLFGALSLLFLGQAAVAALPAGGPAEAWTGTQIATQSGIIVGNIGSFTAGYSLQMKLNHEMIMSALQIATKQESVSQHQVADSTRKAYQMQAEAELAQQKTRDIIKANIDYNPVTGQGHKACLVMQQNSTVERKFDDINENARVLITKLDNAPTNLVQDVNAAIDARLKEHNDLFCTEAEAKAGICTLGKIPGADTNAATLTSAAKRGSTEEKAQIAYIQNVLGTPDPALPKSAGGTSAGQEYLYTKNKKDALMALPAYSLAAIKEANTIDDSTGKTPNQLLTERVNSYFGGKEAIEWAGTLSRSAPRGLLVESLKVGGIQTWLNFQELQQAQRINGNLAALLIAANNGNQQAVQGKYLESLSNSITKGN